MGMGMGIDFENLMGMGMGIGMTFENGYECRYSYTRSEPVPRPSLEQAKKDESVDGLVWLVFSVSQ